MGEGFFSITVSYRTKLKVEKYARNKDRSESWIVTRAIDRLKEEDLD